jgi:hypothetical protein
MADFLPRQAHLVKLTANPFPEAIVGGKQDGHGVTLSP